VPGRRCYDNHPIHDLHYVALAERRRTRLITADAALRQRLIGIDRLVLPDELVR
jgi:predicted nucleic acid-binding protein